MDELTTDEAETRERRPRRRWPRLLALLAMLLLAGLVVLWLLRVRIATDFIDRELARRDVQATYDVRRIGFGTQRFENLRIGDPAAPDLTARAVDIDVRVTLGGLKVGLITARGVRLRGRVLDDGRVSFGEVDKLLPPPTGLPFRLPDQRVNLADAALVLDTPAGRAAFAIAGRGQLSDGFEGNIAMVSRGLTLGGCQIAVPQARVAVRVRALRPTFTGPAEAARIACGDSVAVAAPRLEVDATLAAAFDAWRGTARGRAGAIAAGPLTLAGARGQLGFAGDARQTRGRIDIGAAGAALNGFQAQAARIAGDYALALTDGRFALDGEAGARGIVGGAAALAPIADTLDSLGGTPLEPIGDALAQAVLRAGAAANADARLAIAGGPAGGSVRVSRLAAASRSGARVALEGGRGLAWSWPDGALALDGTLALAGGGFPDTRLALTQARPGGAISGTGRIAPYTAGDARAVFGPLRFGPARGGGVRIESFATLDGPIPDGFVRGLAMPVDLELGAGGSLRLGAGCRPVRWQALRVDTFVLGPTALTACPVGPALIWRPAGGRVRAVADIAVPRLAGTVGGAPIRIAPDRLRFDFTDFAFDSTNASISIGPEGEATRIRMARFAGSFEGNDLAGPFEALSARIPNVPLLADEGQGRWRLAGGVLRLDGRVRISDAEDPSRFYPLVSDDFRLTLDGETIRAGGWLAHPASGTRVTEADIVHNLTTGAGRAVLDVPGLAFRPGFQPDDLTRLTLGVVSLVDGTVAGRGTVAWNEAGVTSSGTFATSGMNLAAPFGPVEGLTTSLTFTDLLGLVTAPGQVARVARVRTGIDVYDGEIVYRLEPNYHVRVERGRWPFAGGELYLEPTVLDFSQESTKFLTFRVVGMDAARFVQQMEFGNIAATGIFDGVVPMQFDARGGRIVGGRLAAREGGGTLSYIGELTDRDLGVYGKLAFDALRSLRYSRFDIGLDGALDGEFLTRIQLDGIARDPGGPVAVAGGGLRGMVAQRALNQLARIPFRFNIRAQGPFRALIGTMRSFDDPTPLIEQVLPGLLDRRKTQIDVQDEESEAVR